MANETELPSPTATGHYIIDPNRDRLLPLRRLPEWHLSRAGVRVHRSAGYRWAQHGVGGVRLPIVRIGGLHYTSEEAIAWWTAALERAAGVRTEEVAL